jgi:hypothetical protein
MLTLWIRSVSDCIGATFGTDVVGEDVGKSVGSGAVGVPVEGAVRLDIVWNID